MLIGNAVGLSYLSFQEKFILKIDFQPTHVQLLMNIEQQSTGHQSQIWIPIKKYRKCWSNDWLQTIPQHSLYNKKTIYCKGECYETDCSAGIVSNTCSWWKNDLNLGKCNMH